MTPEQFSSSPQQASEVMALRQQAQRLAEQGNLQAAATTLFQAHAMQPGDPQTLSPLGMLLMQLGSFEMADQVFDEWTTHVPGDANAWFCLGTARQMLRRPAEAVQAFRESLELDGGNLPAWVNLGSVLLALGDAKEGESCFRRALAIDPGNLQALVNLGICLGSQGRFADALPCFQDAAQQVPEHPLILANLGSCLASLQRPTDAEPVLRRALALQPASAEAAVNLGAVLVALGRADEAETLLRTVLAALPQDPRLYVGLAACLTSSSRHGEAEAVLRQALTVAPDYPPVLTDLALLCLSLQRYDDAMAYARQAQRVQPDDKVSLSTLAKVLEVNGDFDEAVACLDRLVTLDPTPANRLRLWLAEEVIPADRQALHERRRALLDGLAALKAEGARITDPARDVAKTPFYFAFQGFNERPLQEALAAFYREACPDLIWQAPHIDVDGNVDSTGRIRLGILSGHLREHIIGMLYEGLIRNLDRQRFHVTVFVLGRRDDWTDRLGRAADDVVYLSGPLATRRQAVADSRLDALVFTDIGMEPDSYFLAHSRLAPVQCVLAGHPVTTGLPTMDYYLSSRLCEPEDAVEHYTEQLVSFSEFPVCYPKPAVTEHRKTKADFGLDPSRKAYLCPQTLFKLHPDFDAWLTAILERDPDGQIVFVDGLCEHWNELLCERLRRVGIAVDERIVFVRRQAYPDFLDLLRVADAVLDPIYFGGGSTNYAAYATGVPVVTWPAPFMRGRVTYGFYVLTGLPELVAQNMSDYVEIAYRLAHDPAWKAGLGQRIAASQAAVFDRTDVIREMEAFWVEAVQARRLRRDS